MLSMEKIQEQLKAIEDKYNIKIDTFGTKKEFRYLPNVIYDNEEIKYITSGFLDGNTWMIACTNKRIVALDKGMVYGMQQKEIPLDKVSSVGFKKKLMFAEVEVITSSTKINISNIFKDQVEYFVKEINSAIDNLKNSGKNQVFNQPAPKSDKEDLNEVIQLLEKLAGLKEKGIITEEEFQAKKKQVLGI